MKNIAKLDDKAAALLAAPDKTATDKWFADHEFPLLDKPKISLTMLSGQDCPALRRAFVEAWARVMPSDQRYLVRQWRSAAAHSVEPRVPWVVGIPHFPSRQVNEFGLTHPSSTVLMFVAPLIELMPYELAVGVCVRELAYAYTFRRGKAVAGPLWASRPRQTWAAANAEVVQSFLDHAQLPDLDDRIATWLDANPTATELSAMLSADAEYYHILIGQHAAHIYS
jgi:hypothetical protein